MLGPVELKAFTRRRYRDALVAIVEDRPFFPLRVPLGTVPTDDLAALKEGNAALEAESVERLGHGVTITWGVTKTRLFNEQKVPLEVAFLKEEDYGRYLKSLAEIHAFRAAVTHTRLELPVLLPWMARHPIRVMEKIRIWPGLLCVCRHFMDHPLPGCYPREIRLPIGSKFIEEEQATLRALLDEVLPPAARTDAPDFHARFGLKLDDVSIRVRWLGAPPPGTAVILPDFSAPLTVLARTDLAPVAVILIENKTTFLTLPPMDDGWLAILGNGNSVLACGALPWLHGRPLHYWGDIDPAGFQILARLRARLPQTQSVLMDLATLEAHRAWWSKAGNVPDTCPDTLMPQERELYLRVRADSIQLEQERVLQAWVDTQIGQLRHRTPEAQPLGRALS